MLLRGRGELENHEMKQTFRLYEAWDDQGLDVGIFVVRSSNVLVGRVGALPGLGLRASSGVV
jgi:hypothetical protein